MTPYGNWPRAFDSLRQLAAEAEQRWPTGVVRAAIAGELCRIACRMDVLHPLSLWLARDHTYALGTLVVETTPIGWWLLYAWYGDAGSGLVEVEVTVAGDSASVPSLAREIHAADWQEREAEDLFGITLEGHPRLGDFVLHNDVWPERVRPMCRDRDAHARWTDRQPDVNWRPRAIVEAEGAFVMSIGPIYAGDEEAAQFLLETVGEDVIQAVPRLFYKYRGVEKLAEGRSVADVLLLAERTAGTTAFAHAAAFSMAVERITHTELPPRAIALRVLLAELERLRHHTGAIERICSATALAVPASQAAILEEELLRLSCIATGHRWMFGAARPGGLSCDLSEPVVAQIARTVARVRRELQALAGRLQYSSSFLDRLEDVGCVTRADAVEYALVGPVARASGLARDLRRVLPYGGYDRVALTVAAEEEGDGFARLRVLFTEADESARLLAEITDHLPTGPVSVAVPQVAGSAMGWVEAPRGAAFHWVRVGDDGRVLRYRLTTPSFTNWHGFHLAAEQFAFQDFPIIMATFGLSVAESDR